MPCSYPPHPPKSSVRNIWIYRSIFRCDNISIHTVIDTANIRPSYVKSSIRFVFKTSHISGVEFTGWKYQVTAERSVTISFSCQKLRGNQTLYLLDTWFSHKDRVFLVFNKMCLSLDSAYGFDFNT